MLYSRSMKPNYKPCRKTNIFCLKRRLLYAINIYANTSSKFDLGRPEIRPNTSDWFRVGQVRSALITKIWNRNFGTQRMVAESIFKIEERE